MNAQAKDLPGAVPMPEKPKPRMTAKRINALLLESFQDGYNRGRNEGFESARDEFDGDRLMSAMGNFSAGVFIGVVAVYPALRWCWHAFRAFVAAHVH